MGMIVEKVDELGRPLRVDLQGLRGLGVLLVVIGHLWLWPPGAFAALDIFFVLSGFFITAILIDQFAQQDRLRLGTFYLARFRRLVPTALTVIVVTVLLTKLLYNPAKADEVTQQGIWAALFASNWYFIENSTNYFANLGNASFIHYWSLSVEEQFYVVWPCLILVTLLTARRRAWSLSTSLLVVFGTATAVSFGYSMWHSAAHPVAAYFSTFDRVWEFGVGALLAVARPLFKDLRERISTGIMWTASAALIASLAFLDYSIQYPAPWGLLPVLACAGLIVGGHSGRVPNRRMWPITNVPMVYLGTISYSFYLWHLPVIFLLRAYFAEDTQFYRAVAFAVSLVVGSLSFHLLERPVRRAQSLMTHAERAHLQNKAPIDLRPVMLGWIAVVTVATVGLYGLVAAQNPSTADSSLSRGPQPTAPTTDDPTASTLERHQEALRASLTASDFPTFDPPLQDLASGKWLGQLNDYRCRLDTMSTLGDCRHGPDDASQTAVLIGDSYASSLAPGIIAALGKGWTVQQFANSGCPAWTLPEYYNADGTPYPLCARRQTEALDFVRREEPDLVILVSAADAYVAGARNFDIDRQNSDLASWALGQTLKKLTDLTKRIVVIEGTPNHKRLLDCVTRFAEPDDCVSSPTSDWELGRAGEQKAAREYGATYVPTLPWFCINGRCPAFMGRTPVTADGRHVTLAFSLRLTALLREALLGTDADTTP
ncbi:MAG: acyltransferase family protein [Propionibacteriales bacterium]|nr:acyltransferase family protein [Propionibacteriales bacterium]